MLIKILFSIFVVVNFFIVAAYAETVQLPVETVQPPAETSTPAADDIQWKEYSNNIFIEDQKVDKLILLYIKATWCEWCQKTDRTTFHNKAVIELVNKYYMPVILDIDKNANEATAYNVSELPTILILDKNNKTIKKLHGYVAPEVMIDNLNQAKGKGTS